MRSGTFYWVTAATAFAFAFVVFASVVVAVAVVVSGIFVVEYENVIESHSARTSGHRHLQQDQHKC